MSDLSEDDLGGDIERAMAELSGATETPAEPPAEAPPPETEAPSDGRVRGPDGKFVAKPPEPEQSAPASPDVQAAPPPETSRPPHTLKATLKAKWATLDPEVRQEFERVEAEAQNAKNEWSPKGERLNKFDALFTPFKEEFALSGIDEFTAAQQLLAAHQFLKRDPNGAIAHLARQYGASLNGVPVSQPTQNQPQDESPALAELRQQVASLTQSLQQQSQAKEQELQQSAVSEWEAFRNDPANPYAENVKTDMALLLREGRAQTIAEAYQAALWLNPETRSLMQTQTATPQAPDKTKPAGLGIVGGAGNVPRNTSVVTPESSLEDDIRAAYRQLGGRA